MKLTKSKLKQIIQEELEAVLQEEEDHICYEDPKDPGNIFWFPSETSKQYCSKYQCIRKRTKPGEKALAESGKLYNKVSCPEYE